MTALEFMRSQVERNYKNLISASKRKGITKDELNSIRSKIGYYKEAVRALEKEEKL